MELHALTQAAHSYVLLNYHINYCAMYLIDFPAGLKTWKVVLLCSKVHIVYQWCQS